MGRTQDVVDGLISLCEAAGITQPLYDAGIPDGAGVPAVAAAFADYSPADDAASTDSVVMVQVSTRSTSDPRPGRLLDDAIADALLGRYPVTLSTGVRLTTIERTSGDSIGRDSVGRWKRTSNYQVGYHRPGPHRH